MTMGAADENKPEFLPIKPSDVLKAVSIQAIWVVLHLVLSLIIVGRKIDPSLEVLLDCTFNTRNLGNRTIQYPIKKW